MKSSHSLLKKKQISSKSHVVLYVRLATGQKQNSAGLVVAVLAAQVEGREAAAVLDVCVGLGLAQDLKSIWKRCASTSAFR